MSPWRILRWVTPRSLSDWPLPDFVVPFFLSVLANLLLARYWSPELPRRLVLMAPGGLGLNVISGNSQHGVSEKFKLLVALGRLISRAFRDAGAVHQRLEKPSRIVEFMAENRLQLRHLGERHMLQLSPCSTLFPKPRLS